MATGPGMGHDHDMLEREAGAAVGHPNRMQSVVGIEYPSDQGG